MIPGIFTTIKVVNGIPLFFEEHKKRLSANTQALSIAFPKNFNKKVSEFIKSSLLKNSALRIEINSQGKLSFQIRDIPSPSSITVVTKIDKRDKNKIYKTTNRSENEKARQYAKENNADDALFINDKKIIESTMSNVFSINDNGEIISPPLTRKGLKGITKKIIMKYIKIKEEEIPEDTNKPIVLTNALRLQKVLKLNGEKLQNPDALYEKISLVLQQAEKEYLFQNKKQHYKKLNKWIDPEKIFQSLFANEPSSFWLDSSLRNQNARFSYMGIPEEIISYSLPNNTTTITEKDKTTKIKQNIFDYLDNKLKIKTLNTENIPFPFIGGYIGYFGYELKKLTGSKFAYPSSTPDSLWFYTTKIIVFDHKEKKIYLTGISENRKETNDWFAYIQKKLLAIAQKQNEKKIIPQIISFKLDRDHKQYLANIKKCKEYLTSGESYQICLTNTFTAKGEVDPFPLYLALRKNNPAPFATYIKHNNLAILSSSPEEFLKIEDRFIQTKPIKGTIRRGEYEEEDKKLFKQLAESKKDWSENAMIVDLLRNDLGKLCEFGTVKIKKLMEIETYQTVHTLVSTITGILKKEISLIDSVRATFPGGSMTGTPKLHTMEIIDSLEKKARGIYSGTIGFLSLNQKAHLSMVIRTLVIQKDTLTIGAGGAILIDSDPQKEYEEMQLKAQALIQTVTSLYNPTMHTVFLALGSNVGNKKENIQKALDLLSKKIENISIGNMYETKPMYYEQQDSFINSALKGETNLSPQELLHFIKDIEKRIGRKKRFRNGPREIDIDILFYDDIIFQTEHVQIPHPKIQERTFVLKPLVDLDPQFVHPVLKKNINDLLKAIA